MCTCYIYRHSPEDNALSNFIDYLNEIIDTFPALVKLACRCCLSEIFETVQENNLHEAVHIHTAFSDLDPFSRSRESEKKERKLFSRFSFECESSGVFMLNFSCWFCFVLYKFCFAVCISM